MKIIVDADACPKRVLQICFELGQAYNVPVWTVANFNHQVHSDNHIVVGNSSQEADIKVVNLAEAKDIVVTQDWGLGAMVLGRGAFAVTPGGKEFRPETIEFMLEERELKAKHRRAGGRTKGPSKRSLEDDRRFQKTLEEILLRNIM